MGPQDYVCDNSGAFKKLLVEELLKIAKTKKAVLDLIMATLVDSPKLCIKLGISKFVREWRYKRFLALMYMGRKYPEIYDPEVKIKLKTMQEYLCRQTRKVLHCLYSWSYRGVNSNFSFWSKKFWLNKAKDVVFYISESGYHYPRFWRLNLIDLDSS